MHQNDRAMGQFHCLRIYVSLHVGRCSLLPVVNNSGAMCNSWKLDPTTLRFPLKGLLPYDKVCLNKLLKPLTFSKTKLLCH